MQEAAVTGSHEEGNTSAQGMDLGASKSAGTAAQPRAGGWLTAARALLAHRSEGAKSGPWLSSLGKRELTGGSLLCRT